MRWVRMLRCFWDGSKKVLGELQKPKAVGRSEWEGSQEGKTEGVSGLMGGAGEEGAVGERDEGGHNKCSMPKEEGGAGIQTPGWALSGGGKCGFQKTERQAMGGMLNVKLCGKHLRHCHLRLLLWERGGRSAARRGWERWRPEGTGDALKELQCSAERGPVGSRGKGLFGVRGRDLHGGLLLSSWKGQPKAQRSGGQPAHQPRGCQVGAMGSRAGTGEGVKARGSRGERRRWRLGKWRSRRAGQWDRRQEQGRENQEHRGTWPVKQVFNLNLEKCVRLRKDKLQAVAMGGTDRGGAGEAFGFEKVSEQGRGGPSPHRRRDGLPAGGEEG